MGSYHRRLVSVASAHEGDEGYRQDHLLAPSAGRILLDQEEVLARLRDGATLDAERDLLDDLAAVMGDASICGLGQMASGAVRSALDLGLLEGSR